MKTTNTQAVNPVKSQTDSNPPTRSQMSSAYIDKANEIASDNTNEIDSIPLASTTIDADRDNSLLPTEPSGPFSTSPSTQGEQSMSGSMPDLESDDDTLATAQAVGFQQDEDSENPKELNMGADIDKAEQAIKES